MEKEQALNANDGGQGQLLQCVIELAARAAELEHHELSIVLFIAAGAQAEGSQAELALLCGQFAKVRLAVRNGFDPEEIKKLLKKDLKLDDDL